MGAKNKQTKNKPNTKGEQELQKRVIGKRVNHRRTFNHRAELKTEES